MMSVVGAKLVDMRVQRLRGKGIDAGIDFATLSLLSAQVLLLDDSLNLVGLLPLPGLRKTRP